jgi:hypothetical protein
VNGEVALSSPLSLQRLLRISGLKFIMTHCSVLDYFEKGVAHIVRQEAKVNSTIARSFSEAVRAVDVFGAGRKWFTRARMLREVFAQVPPERLLVLPRAALMSDAVGVARVLQEFLGLPEFNASRVPTGRVQAYKTCGTCVDLKSEAATRTYRSVRETADVCGNGALLRRLRITFSEDFALARELHNMTHALDPDHWIRKFFLMPSASCMRGQT